MSDLDWERTIPIRDMPQDEIQSIFAEYDKSLVVGDFHPIGLGCKNSNFVVETDQGRFVLRVTAKGLNNEKNVYELVKDPICVPSLLFHRVRENAEVLIYQYISGVSLQKHLVESGRCDPSVLEQVARAAAMLHNTPKEKTAELAAYDVPPYEVWYEAFLDHPAVKARMGEAMRERVLRLAIDKRRWIAEIDGLKSLIHGDFRPANMLIDQQGQVFFVDWESAWWGHPLADIGQFFRYRPLFKDSDFMLFERVYNSHAENKLPDNWIELSLFRDLVNPLQLLSADQEAPRRNADLISIVEGTLAYWGY